MSMLGTQDLWIFISAGVALNLAPGQDFVFIANRSSNFGFRGGVLAALGVTTGTLVHILAAAFGLSALMIGSPNTFILIKVMGGLYLLYMGLCMLLKNPTKAHNTVSSVGYFNHSTIFYQGFLTNALNPKVALFFIAFVPQFIVPDTPNTSLTFLFLGFIFSFNGLVWCLIVAWFSAHISTKFKHALRLTRWSNMAAGGLFTYFGVSLLMSSGH